MNIRDVVIISSLKGRTTVIMYPRIEDAENFDPVEHDNILGPIGDFFADRNIWGLAFVEKVNPYTH